MWGRNFCLWGRNLSVNLGASMAQAYFRPRIYARSKLLFVRSKIQSCYKPFIGEVGKFAYWSLQKCLRGLWSNFKTRSDPDRTSHKVWSKIDVAVWHETFVTGVGTIYILVQIANGFLKTFALGARGQPQFPLTCDESSCQIARQVFLWTRPV